ncbi:MAG: hypothetical protein K6C34_04530 [Alphaproteobacteria bacterium]|nr:hypothetical protein [Alphaproteobacteria bacterium]
MKKIVTTCVLSVLCACAQFSCKASQGLGMKRPLSSSLPDEGSSKGAPGAIPSKQKHYDSTSEEQVVVFNSHLISGDLSQLMSAIEVLRRARKDPLSILIEQMSPRSKKIYSRIKRRERSLSFTEVQRECDENHPSTEPLVEPISASQEIRSDSSDGRSSSLEVSDEDQILDENTLPHVANCVSASHSPLPQKRSDVVGGGGSKTSYAPPTAAAVASSSSSFHKLDVIVLEDDTPTQPPAPTFKVPTVIPVINISKLNKANRANCAKMSTPAGQQSVMAFFAPKPSEDEKPQSANVGSSAVQHYEGFSAFYSLYIQMTDLRIAEISTETLKTTLLPCTGILPLDFRLPYINALVIPPNRKDVDVGNVLPAVCSASKIAPNTVKAIVCNGNDAYRTNIPVHITMIVLLGSNKLYQLPIGSWYRGEKTRNEDNSIIVASTFKRPLTYKTGREQK